MTIKIQESFLVTCLFRPVCRLQMCPMVLQQSGFDSEASTVWFSDLKNYQKGRGCCLLPRNLLLQHVFLQSWQGMKRHLIRKSRLGGGNSNMFFFTPICGEMIQFDEHIFQMGWLNHQLAMLVKHYSIWPESWELKGTPMPTQNSRPYEGWPKKNYVFLTKPWRIFPY